MKPQRVYIAGPMRGYPELNFPAFQDAAKKLRKVFTEVISPVELNHSPGAPSRTHEECLSRDIAALLGCDAIVLLPGWEGSVGARCEATVAVSLGLTFVEINRGGEVIWPVSPPGRFEICGGYEESRR